LQCIAVRCSVCCSVLQHLRIKFNGADPIDPSAHMAFVWQRVAVYCSVLQCVAVGGSVLQCVAVCCSVLQFVAGCCSACCSVLLRVAVLVAMCCSALQCVLQCVAAPAHQIQRGRPDRPQRTHGFLIEFQRLNILIWRIDPMRCFAREIPLFCVCFCFVLMYLNLFCWIWIWFDFILVWFWCGFMYCFLIEFQRLNVLIWRINPMRCFAHYIAVVVSVCVIVFEHILMDLNLIWI